MPVSSPSSTRSSRILTGTEIRRAFIDYFVQRRGHAFVPSSPVVPHDDPTLLFTNAGMNQFKPIFLGQETRPYTRAVNTQKCIRAGGKHNDLEDVGKDTYHHTFFEMLGNWSFGDYFKAEAIEWSWDLLTNVYGIAPDRLYATYFEGDKKAGLDPDFETRDLWLRHLPAERVLPGNMKDNFWEMGETGPCGPCTEIHYDRIGGRNAAKLVNAGDPNVLEIWNNVFIQFNRNQDRSLTPLPARHVDTGMGFERLTSVLQNKLSNYDTDIWSPIFRAIQEKTGARAYSGSLDDHIDIAYRVIADHVRCLTIAITDGALPSNEGRGYVLRRILRRAVRHAHQTLGVKGPVLYQLVQAVVDSLGEAFPELRKKPKHVAQVIREEEEAFLRTLDRGLLLFRANVLEAIGHELARMRGKKLSFIREGIGVSTADGRDISGVNYLLEDEKGQREPVHFDSFESLVHVVSKWKQHPKFAALPAFQLHDTFGFPIDLTRVMANECGVDVDEEGFDKLMEQARERSRAGGAGAGGDMELSINLPPDALAKLKHLGVEPTHDEPKYAAKPIPATVRAIWNGRDFDDMATSGRTVAVILDRTNFYAEQGGQVGDKGFLLAEPHEGRLPVRGQMLERSSGGATFEVADTHVITAPGGAYVLHIGRCAERSLRVGDTITAEVERRHREPVRANHTATHMLNLALREVLGTEVEQKGSLVAPDRLRFDFSHHQALTPHQVEEVQRLVSEQIEEDLQVEVGIVPLETARRIRGVRAVFGEKYPDPVRVVSIGAPIKELLADPGSEQWMEFSIEFCGGTHLERTSKAERFVILTEQALASGVRRIVALTGPAAVAANIAGMELLDRVDVAADFEDDRLPGEVDEIARLAESLTLGLVTRHRVQEKLEGLRERAKQIRKQAQQFGREAVVAEARELAETTDAPVIVRSIAAGDRDLLLTALDTVCARRPSSAVMLLTVDLAGEKVILVARVPKELIAKGLKAGDWVKAAASACGGSGGGKPDMAQAGGKDPAKINDAIDAARGFAQKVMP